ncbi:MAG: hypothetical protein ACKV2O_14105 [Acidimicrobiales bacterium]
MSRTKFVRSAVAASLLATGAVAALSPNPAGAQTANQTKAYIEVPAGASAFPVGDYSITAANVALTGTNAGPLVFTMDDGTGTDFVLTLTPRTGDTFTDVLNTDAVTPATNIETTTVATETSADAGMTLTRAGSTCTNPTGEFSIDGADLTAGAQYGAAVRFTITCNGETAAYSASGQAYLNWEAFPLRAVARSEFVSMSPVRLFDTRFSTQMGPAATRDIDVTKNLETDPSTVPSTATAVVLNITAINPSVATFLSLYPTGTTRPGVSNINPAAGVTVANLATVKVGTAGQVTLYNEVGNTHVAVDVVGYYVPDNSAAGGGRYVSQVPERKLDTRLASGGAAPLAAGATRTLNLGTASGVDAAIVNLTVEAPTAGGYAAVFPGDTVGVPNVSNVNFIPGQTTANMVVVKVVSGEIKIHNPTTGTVDVMVDLIGTFVADSGGPDQSGFFVPVEPVRTYDSRDLGDTPLAARSFRDVNLLLERGLYPFEYTSVMANLTVEGGTNLGFLTAYPAADAASRPFVSNVNWNPGQTVANQFVSGTDLDGFTGFFHGADSNTGSVDFFVDVAGYFTQG